MSAAKSWGSAAARPLRWDVQFLDADGPGRWRTLSRHRAADVAQAALDAERDKFPTTTHRICRIYGTE